jgi:hypothetical protein
MKFALFMIAAATLGALVVAPAASAATSLYFQGQTAIHQSKYTSPTTVKGGQSWVNYSGPYIARIYTKTAGFVEVYGATAVTSVNMDHPTLTGHVSMCSWSTAPYTTVTRELHCWRKY